MVGAEKSKQDQQHEAALAAKQDPRDGAEPGHLGRHLERVSVCGYRGSSLATSTRMAQSRIARWVGCVFRCAERYPRLGARKPGYSLKEGLRVAKQRLRDAPHPSRTTNWLGIRSLLPGIILATVLSACSGNMQGVVRGTGQPITFTYEQNMSSDLLTAQIDGEAFSGKAVMRGATTSIGTGFGTAVAGTATGFGTSTIFGASYTGDFVATLIGDRGSTLSCELQYADTSGYTTAGGVGVCRHSDGRVIDIV